MVLPSARAMWRRVMIVVLACVVALGVVGVPTHPAPAQANDVPVPRSLFGMHDSVGMGSLAALQPGWVRLWDVGTQWREIETARGVYDWTILDALVGQAEDAGAEITMVVAMTPSFYSADPTLVPSAAVWHYRQFVQALMTRYRGRIGSYQVWNEANVATFWNGTPARMARLTKVMASVRDVVDPDALVVGPQLITRFKSMRTWMAEYQRQLVDGTPVWRYYDVVSLALYPLSSYGERTGVPEDAIRLLRASKRKLRDAGVPSTKPIWDTEVNYGLRGGNKAGTSAAPIPRAAQAANVIRTYLLHAANRVDRVGWYRYAWGRLPDGGTLGNTLLTDPDDPSRITAAGRAYALAQSWMQGTLRAPAGERPCQPNSAGTYTCVITDERGTKRIYWNPFGVGRVRLPLTARYRQDVFGVATRVTGGDTILVDYRPVLIYG